MNLFINSPSYYTQEYGVIDDIYIMCNYISCHIDVTNYTEHIDTIGILPMIAPVDFLNKNNWKEKKLISTTYRMASISLSADYDSFYMGNLEDKKNIILDNILRSLKEIKRKLKGKFDYDNIERDIKALVNRTEYSSTS